MKTIAMVKRRIKLELREPANPEDFNFWVAAHDARTAIAAAAETGDACSVRSAAAAFGGLVKRWRRFLIEALTEVALQQQDTSRDYVRAWQQRVFGQAVASVRLAQYAKTARSGGGRAAFAGVPERLEKEVADLFEPAKDEIKHVMSV